MRLRQLVVLGGAAAVLFGTVACGSPTTAGSPTPGAGGTTTAGDPPPNGGGDSTGSAPSTGGGSADLMSQPCSLLSSGDLSRLGAASPGSVDQVGGSTTCEVDTADYSIGVGGWPNQGLSEVTVNGPEKDVTIGGHQGKQVQDNATGGCLVAIGLTTSSRVDVTTDALSGAPSCDEAMKVAALVEPHLP